MMKSAQLVLVAAAMTLGVVTASAKELRCVVVEKVGTPEGTLSSHPPKDIMKLSYAVIIRDKGADGSEIGRCSYSSSASRVTCNFYAVDRIERDTEVGHVKYYHFARQFDVQIFADMRFIENNGRGELASGTCERTD
jgi:hypothetical protein